MTKLPVRPRALRFILAAGCGLTLSLLAAQARAQTTDAALTTATGTIPPTHLQPQRAPASNATPSAAEEKQAVAMVNPQGQSRHLARATPFISSVTFR